MTEGMVTRSRALDDQLSNLTELVTKQDAKMDALSVTVQQHAETFEMLQKSLASQQAVMADMMVKLARSDKAPPCPTPPQPPLLPLPPGPVTTASSHTAPLGPQPTGPSRLPRLEIPPFSGEDVTGWLFQANHFFTFHQTPVDQRVTIAAFYMVGPALQWFQWIHLTRQTTPWEEFACQLELRFGL